MNKETLTATEKAQKEFAQKRTLLEDVLIDKLLHEIRRKIQIEEGDIVFRVANRESFEVMKIEGDRAEVVSYTKLGQKDTTISMLNFSLSELWSEHDFLPIEEKVLQLSDLEIRAKISGLDTPADSIN